MATLYELTMDFMACIELENGDVVNSETGEVLSYEQLDALVMERDRKIEAIACQIKNLVSDADAIGMEIAVLKNRKDMAERKAEWLRNYLYANLNGEKFSTAKCAVGFRKSQAVDIANENEMRAWAISFHPEMLTVQEPKINKAEVKRCLKDGETVPGAALVERLNIQIK